MSKASGEFFNEEEKLKFYADISNCNLTEYWLTSSVKVYTGAEIVLFHWSSDQELIFDTVLMCTNISLSNDLGVKVTLIDRRNNNISTITEIPSLFNGGYNIVSHVPYRCMIERTIKMTKQRRPLQGITSTITFRSKSRPISRIPGHVQAANYTTLWKLFGHEDIDLALARLEAKG